MPLGKPGPTAPPRSDAGSRPGRAPAAHESPRKSWKRMGPCVVSASKLGASSPSSRPGIVESSAPLGTRSALLGPARLAGGGVTSAPAHTRRPSPDVTERRALRRFAASASPCSAAMATYVSELEAAKKSLSEALGENVKQ